jgi:tetratricopeptide (TPR) repeat protein
MVVRGATALALAGAAAVLLLPITRSVPEDHDLVTRAAEPAPSDLRAAIERHPLDYLAFGQTAAVLLRSGDPRAPKFLNHALILHPSHPGLHRLAAHMLIASGRRSQAALEFALALRGTLAPNHLMTEIVTLLPELDLAAAAIPPDALDRSQILRTLGELGRDDIAERWLLRVVLGAQHDLALIDRLYALAMKRGDLEVAEQAARRRLAESHTSTSRLMLARAMFRREQFDQVLKDLADVPTWKGRIDEQADAWLLVCDTHIEKRAWDLALECLHKLDGSGIIAPARRLDITRRLAIVDDARSSEAKQKAIEEMERALRSPAK